MSTEGLGMTHQTIVRTVWDELWDVDEYRGECLDESCSWRSNLYPTRDSAQIAADNHRRIHGG